MNTRIPSVVFASVFPLTRHSLTLCAHLPQFTDCKDTEDLEHAECRAPELLTLPGATRKFFVLCQ